MKKKVLLLVIILIVILSFAVACNDIDNANGEKNNTNDDKFSGISDSYLLKDFENALIEIGADKMKMSKVEKIGDWAGGTRYQFTYANKISIIVYCNMNSTVDSINYNDEKIYYRGYESYNINQYVYDPSHIEYLIPYSQEVVKSYLNYPLTAKFPLTSSEWAVERYNNIYYLSSWVKASNAFGVESKSDFKIGVSLKEGASGNNYQIIYFKIGGEEKINVVKDFVSSEERRQVEPKYPNKNNGSDINGIHLVYGQLGVYGKNEVENGYSYIAYYVPSGKYNVVNNGNVGTFFVTNDVDTKTYRFENGSNDKKIEIIVPSGYHIELAMQTNITLQLVKEDNAEGDKENKEEDNKNENQNNGTYNVAIHTNNNLAGDVYGSGNYDYGSNVTIYASINCGYDWLGWYDSSDEIVTTDLKYEFRMSANDITYTAKWVVKEEMLPFEFISTVNTLVIIGIIDDTISEIEMPDYVTGIGDSAFSGCKHLTSVKMPRSIMDIGDRAFNECSGLTTIIIPNSVLNIGKYAFNGCYGLTIFCEAKERQDGWNSYWNNNGGVVVWDCRNNDRAVDNNIYYVDENGIRYALVDGVAIVTRQSSELSGMVIISNQLEYKGEKYEVKSIDQLAFYYCNYLTGIKISSGITNIGSHAFYWCNNLTDIILPNSLTTIGISAFAGCSNLEKIIIPNGVTIIGNSAFDYCISLKSIRIPSSVKNIGTAAFSDCVSLESITVDTNNEKYRSEDNCIIDKETNTLIAAGCKTTIIPNSVTTIWTAAFSGCRDLTSIVIPNGVICIVTTAFKGCNNLTSMTFENTEGWYHIYSDVSKGSDIDVSNPLDNANKINSYYYDGYWKRNV